MRARRPLRWLSGRLGPPRANHAGPHSKAQVNKQRRLALIMIVTGLIRVIVWVSLIVMYVAGVHFTKDLFASVSFVAMISLYANAATDWGQVAASLSQLTAADAHQDVEHVRLEHKIGIADRP